MDKQPSFRERIELLEQAARCLDEAAATIAAEVERMAAAEKRFAETRRQKQRRAARPAHYQPHHSTMPTTASEDMPIGEPQEPEEEFTICPNCGADLLWHRCEDVTRRSHYQLTFTPMTTDEISERTRTIAALNDAARADLARNTIVDYLSSEELIITRGVVARGWELHRTGSCRRARVRRLHAGQ